MVNCVAGLAAYTHQEKKPSLNIIIPGYEQIAFSF
jgi:hypothetical protein